MNDSKRCSCGRWKTPGVPHKGWSCVGVREARPSKKTCEMCEVAAVRFVHRMAHPEYPAILEVGVTCAENMEDDYVTPRVRERAEVNRAARRRYFTKRKGWRTDPDGTQHLHTRNRIVSICLYPDFSIIIIRDNEFGLLCVQKIEGLPDLCELKKRAFDALISVETKGG